MFALNLLFLLLLVGVVLVGVVLRRRGERGGAGYAVVGVAVAVALGALLTLVLARAQPRSNVVGARLDAGRDTAPGGRREARRPVEWMIPETVGTTPADVPDELRAAARGAIESGRLTMPPTATDEQQQEETLGALLDKFEAEHAYLLEAIAYEGSRKSQAVSNVEPLPRVRVSKAPAAPPKPRRVTGPSWGWMAVSVAALGVMIFLAYLFLDADTRGQFTWTLRIFSVAAFAAVCVSIVLLRPAW